VFTIGGSAFTIMDRGAGDWRLIAEPTAYPQGFAPGAQSMPNERISMSKLKQLIGLQASNLSVRALARALDLSVGAVSKYLRAIKTARIAADEAQTLSEADLERRVFGEALPDKSPALVPPDCAWIHTELKRHRHVTLQLRLGIRGARDQDCACVRQRADDATFRVAAATPVTGVGVCHANSSVVAFPPVAGGASSSATSTAASPVL